MTPAELRLALRRRWWLVVGLPAAVAVLSLFTQSRRPLTYQARLGLALDVPQELIVPTSDAGAAKVGETLVDDISRVVRGSRFAEAVAERVGPGGPVAGEIESSLSATDRHRVLDVTVTRALAAGASEADRMELGERLTAIALGVGAELAENGGDWFGLLGAEGARLTTVNGPVVVLAPPSLRDKMELPLRVLAGAALGAALAIALWALDPSVRTAADAACAGAAPILGRVPAGRRG